MKHAARIYLVPDGSLVADIDRRALLRKLEERATDSRVRLSHLKRHGAQEAAKVVACFVAFPKEVVARRVFLQILDDITREHRFPRCGRPFQPKIARCQ